MYSCKYHVVWCPKYRRKVLVNGVDVRLKALIEEVCNDYHIDIIEMEGIYTTCVVPETLDESPMAYKSMAEIIDQIEPTVEIVQRIRPVYNFKAAD